MRTVHVSPEGIPYTLRDCDASWAAKRQRLDRDSHRPRYHFQPRAGEWMNDVIPFFWQGVYHVFIQYAPTTDWVWRHWGHARSRDLVHWEEMPIAIWSGPEPYDDGLAMSGCAWADDTGRVHIFYSGASTAMGQTQCHAVAEDHDLLRWTKDPANPLMTYDTHPDPAYDQEKVWRDPDIWREGDHWHMLLASAWQTGGGAVPLYVSADLRQWQYAGCFYQTDLFSYLEYPHFFHLEGKDILMTSVGEVGTTVYDVGQVVDGVFHSEGQTRYDATLSCGGKTLLDDRGRRICMSWILEDKYGSPLHTDPRLVGAGWAGVMSLPRVLHLADDGSLRQLPAEELQTLRADHQTVPATTIDAEDHAEDIQLLDDIHGDCLEIIARFHPEGAKQFGLLVRCAPNQSEMTRIEVDAEQKKLRIDNTKGSLDPGLEHHVLELDFPSAADSQVELRTFVDRSVIEVFANQGQTVITGRVYPTRGDSLGVGLWSAGGPVRCEQLDIWEMRPIVSRV